MAVSFHRRYVALAEEIEHKFRVAQWRSGDVDIWPLARFDLYLDMYRQSVGDALPMPHAFPLRVAGNLLRQLRNIWKSRHDLGHWVGRPNPAYSILLGDGVSLDFVDNAWIDRFGEPLIATLEKQGLNTFLMQAGDLSRLPWHRPTFAANLITSRGWLRSLGSGAPPDLPDHTRVLQFLSENGVDAPSLAAPALSTRAGEVSGTAAAFEALLRRVQPRLAFVITSFAGPGPGFVLACRRQGILSVDLQRAPIAGTPMTYAWSAVPEHGYTTLPAVFWTWSAEDAAVVQNWAERLTVPWHLGLHGGHTQLAAFRTGGNSDWDDRFAAFGAPGAREILIALQPLGGHRALWDALAAQIEAAPSDWRWWIRRHPASRLTQDIAYGRLLSLRRPNVLIQPASSMPLPALLRHMHVVVSLGSGAASEAESFGVPALFLSKDALGPFGELVARGAARIVSVENLIHEIARLPAAISPGPAIASPDHTQTLQRLDGLAQNYAFLRQAAMHHEHQSSETRALHLTMKA